MLYSEPSPVQLKETLRNLNYHSTYQNVLKTVQSFLDIEDENAHTILLSACVYGLETIATSYHILPPDGSRLFNAGSQLYKSLLSALAISAENPLNDQQRLIYLIRFYQYIEHHPQTLNGLPATQGNPLLDDIACRLKTLLGRLAPDIAILLKRPPTLLTLCREMSTIPQEYKTPQVGFLSYIGWKNTPIERHHQIDLISRVTQHIAAEEKIADEYEVRFGLFLYLMKQIEKEYITRSPANSELYKMLQRALNISHSNEICPETQRKYLQHLATIILTLKEATPSSIDNLLHSTDIHLADQISALAHQEPQSSFVSADKIFKMLTNFGVKIYLGEALLNFADHYMLFDNIAALIGQTVWPHAILAVIVASFIKNQLKSNFISTITTQTNHIVLYTAQQTIEISSKSMEFFHSLMSNLTDCHLQENVASSAWIPALLELPDHLFDPAKKTLLKRVVDVAEDIVPAALPAYRAAV